MNALAFQALRRIADGQFHSGEAVARSLGRTRAALSEALKSAPALGVALEGVRGKGYRLAEPIEFLDAQAIALALGAAASRLHLELADEVDSTSTRLLQRAAAGAPSGTCLAAEWQRAGRGRRGRTWIAGLGASLTFSVLWRFERGAGHLAGLSLAVGVALARALHACGVDRAQVKWPNDLVVDGRKLAGILVETSGEMQGPSVAVIGVGINHRIADRLARRIDQPVADVAGSASRPVSRNALLGRALAEIAAVLEEFERSGFPATREAWRALHAWQGRRARIVPPRDAPFEADVIDIAEDGSLIVRADGRTLQLSSAEIEGAEPATASLRPPESVR